MEKYIFEVHVVEDPLWKDEFRIYARRENSEKVEYIVHIFNDKTIAGLVCKTMNKCYQLGLEHGSKRFLDFCLENVGDK